MRPRVVPIAVLLVVIMTAASADAQETRTGIAELRFSPGVVRQGGVFGDDDPEGAGSTFGVTAGLQVRLSPTRRAGLVFEAVLQPVGVRNPHFDETLRSLYTQVGIEIGRRTYVRPSLGVAFRSWSGASAGEATSLAPAIGLAIGRRGLPTAGVSVWPELVLLSSFEAGAWHWMIGVQVPIARAR